MNPAMRPPEEEWDPEYTPKSRKYYLVSVSVADATERPSAAPVSFGRFYVFMLYNCNAITRLQLHVRFPIRSEKNRIEDIY